MYKLQLIQGDCLDKLKELDSNSIDSIVTDPPYELGFMGKSWDNTGIANSKEMWAECLRVLKPGGHLLAFSGTRTYHRMAVAIEDAGFEVRDMMCWAYGQGFPKSHNIGKAVDKLQGNEREDLGESEYASRASKSQPYGQGVDGANDTRRITKGTSQWEGWGTALKPSIEPICMARKPLSEKTVALNCLKYGTGGINIDESRVGTTTETHSKSSESAKGNGIFGKYGSVKTEVKDYGRFPANLIHDNSEEVRECFPESGKGNCGGVYNYAGREYNNKDTSMFNGDKPQAPSNFNDSGNASRFFKSIIYTAKASKSERNMGCEEMDKGEVKHYTKNRRCKICGHQEVSGSPCKCENPDWEIIERPVMKGGNSHPTVKPVALMEYLIKMVTPKGGIVLDPFMGSGTTGIACRKLNYGFIGIELEPDYITIAKARIDSIKAVQEKLL